MNRICEDIVEELHDYARGELGAERTSAVSRHVAACRGCGAELEQLQKLDRLLAESLLGPSITPSPTFASRFANRLAAEIADEEARAAETGFWHWLARPWLVPAAAAAVLTVAALVVWGPGGRGSQPAGPSSAAVASRAEAGPKPIAKAGAATTAPRVAEARKLPPELMKHPDLFVDYAVIRDLGILQETEGGAQPAG